MLSRKRLEAYLQGEQLEYHLDEDDADRIVVVFQTKQLSNVSLDITILNHRTVLFLSRMPISIPSQYRMAVCEFITRVNYGVVLGGFELDLDEEISITKSLARSAVKTKWIRKHSAGCFIWATACLINIHLASYPFSMAERMQNRRINLLRNHNKKVRDKTMAFDLKQIAKYYKEDMELNFALEEENNRIRFSMDTDAMKEVRFMAYKENPQTMLFLTYLPMKVNEDKRAEVADYLTRANYGLHVGNFEMDMEDGEVRYKTTGVTDEKTAPSLDVIRRLTYIGFSMFDRYIPSLLSIVYGEKTAQEAIAEAEKDMQ